MMRSPNRWITAFILGVLAVLGRTVVQAEEPAATNELPLALRALKVSGSNQLTGRQAHHVRGAGPWFATDGVVVQFRGTSRLPNGRFEWEGAAGGDHVTMTFDSTGLSFRTDGMAVIGPEMPYQGVIAAKTGVFDGQLLFRGNRSMLSITAVPGTFAVEFR